MMSVLDYAEFRSHVEIIPNDEYFVGRLAGINDIMGLSGSIIIELKAAFHDAIDNNFETGHMTEKPRDIR